MIAVNYTKIRENMKSFMDSVTDDYETVIITRKSKNVVLISEEAYNNLLENAYLHNSKANFEWLMKSKEQFVNGEIETHELNLDDDAD